MSMPDRFDEVWKVKDESGKWVEFIAFRGTTIYNQAYRGTRAQGGLVASRVRNMGGKRIVYAVRMNSNAAKKIYLAVCEVLWNGVDKRTYTCAPAKYRKDKRCELGDGQSFVFTSVREYVSAYRRDGFGGFMATCVI
jgi:hypothetical protein